MPSTTESVTAWLVGKHMIFATAPAGTPNTVVAVALYSDSCTSAASFNVQNEARAARAPNVDQYGHPRRKSPRAPALTQTFASRVHAARVAAHAGRMDAADGLRSVRVNAPRRSTSIEFRSIRTRSSPSGAPLSNVSRTPTASRRGCATERICAFHAAEAAGSASRRSTCERRHRTFRATPRPHFASATESPQQAGRANEALLALDPRSPDARAHARSSQHGLRRRRSSGRRCPPRRRRQAASRSRRSPVQEITALSTRCAEPFGGTCLGELTRRDAHTTTLQAGADVHHPGRLDELQRPRATSASYRRAGTGRRTRRQRQDRPRRYLHEIAPAGSRCGDDARRRSDPPPHSPLAANDRRWLSRPEAGHGRWLSGFVVDFAWPRLDEDVSLVARLSRRLQIIHGVLPTVPGEIRGASGPVRRCASTCSDYKHGDARDRDRCGRATRGSTPTSASSRRSASRSYGSSDQEKRVRVSRGASPPGRMPRCTSSDGQRPSRISAVAIARALRRASESGKPATTMVAGATATTRPSSVASARTGSAATPTTRCVASDASASSLLASRWPRRGSARVPTSRSGAPVANASHAPSSSAAQSFSPPPNGTKTPSPRAASRVRAAERRRDRRASARRSPPGRSAPHRVELGRRVEQHEIDVVRRREAHDIARRLERGERRRPGRDARATPRGR